MDHINLSSNNQFLSDLKSGTGTFCKRGPSGVEQEKLKISFCVILPVFIWVFGTESKSFSKTGITSSSYNEWWLPV